MASAGLEVAWSQIQGRRSSQQDDARCLCLGANRHLLVLADGMGGEAGGDIASSLAVRSFCAAFEAHDSPGEPQRAITLEERTERLVVALTSANIALYDRVTAEPQLAGMGTTLIGAVLDGTELHWISVGDSPMWLFRSGSLRRLNANHSVAGRLSEQVAAGEVTVQEARSAPNRSQLLEAVMGRDIRLVDVPVEPVTLQAGDVLLLASDGVESCSPDELVEVLANGHNCDAMGLVDRLLDAVEAHEHPFQDNATLIAVRVSANHSDERR